jgi:hypothetical protein
MKTFHFYDKYLAEFLEWKILQTRAAIKIKAHILYLVIFF